MYQDYETAEGSREPSIDPRLMTGEYIVGSDGIPYGPFPVAQRDAGLPSPDAHAVAASVQPEPLVVVVRRILRRREVAAISHEEAVTNILAAVAQDAEMSAPAYTPWLTLSAAEIERVLTDCPGVVMQAQDTGDEETPHDLTVSECAGYVEPCDADLDEDDPDPCVLLVSDAFPGGRMHTPPFELVAVRIGAEA